MVPSFYNCLAFKYHMYGGNVGRLNIYSQTQNEQKVILWRLSRNHGNRWNQALLPISSDYPYKVCVSVTLGKDNS